MSVVRKTIEQLPIDTQNIIMASWRDSTKKQYDIYIRQWSDFASNQGFDSFTPTIKQVLLFMTAEFNRGASYSKLNTIRSALSTYIFIDGLQLGNIPLVKRFMKGVFQLRPALPRNSVTWNPEIVLTHLGRLDNNTVSLKELTFKTVTLLALSTAQRAQSLHIIDIRNMSLGENFLKIRFGDILKQTRPGFHQGEIEIQAFPEKSKCVVTCVKINT